MNSPTQTSKNIKKTILNNQRFTILFYGDSDTSTEWIQPSWRHIIEYVLKNELEKFESLELAKGVWNCSWWNIHFINAALDGATTQDFLARVEQDVLQYKPEMVIYLGGGNDVDTISPGQHAANSRKLVELITEKVFEVYFCTSVRTKSNDYNSKYQAYLSALKNAISDTRANFVDVFGRMDVLPLEEIYTLKVDPVAEAFLTDGQGGDTDVYHSNSLGQAYIAQILLLDIFGVTFDPQQYIRDIKDDTVKYPRY